LQLLSSMQQAQHGAVHDCELHSTFDCGVRRLEEVCCDKQCCAMDAMLIDHIMHFIQGQ